MSKDKNIFKATWAYADAPESTDHVKIKKQYELFIDGEFVKPSKKKYFDTIDPSNQKRLQVLQKHLLMMLTKQSLLLTKHLPLGLNYQVKERGKYIFRIARLIQERAREFAVIESLDGGKPIRESRDIDIPLAASHFFYYAGWADKLEYAFPNRKVKPVGVAGQIIPWNFPLLMAAWKIAPALATGNTVVLKPAETTSLTALKLAEIIEESGLPKGVVNIVTGAGETGAAIVNHPDVDKIAFTGSTGVGKYIQKATAGTAKKLTLELGGNGSKYHF